MNQQKRAELMSQYGLDEKMMQRKCSKEHLYKIEQFIDVDQVGRHLPGIDKVALGDISDDYSKAFLRRRQLIELWVQRNGDGANYDSMITAMITGKMIEDATKVCEMLADDKSERAIKRQKSDGDYTPLMEACRVGDVKMAKFVLDRGFDPNKCNTEGWTALMAAAHNGNYGTVDLLLERGAKPDLQDNSGWTALMAAVFKGYNDIALRIIQAGATPHLQDNNKTNALLLAIAKNNQEVVVDALLDSNPDVNLQDSYGETALMFACKLENVKLVKRLLLMGADPNICNYSEQSPSLIATRKRNFELMEALADHNADLDETGVNSVSPLTVACEMESNEAVDFLLSRGANPKQRDKNGVSPYDVAKNKNPELAKKLLNPNEQPPAPPSGGYLQMTLSLLVDLQKHLNLGPLFLEPGEKPSYGVKVIGDVLENVTQ